MKYPKFIKENDTIGIIAPSAGAYDIKKKNKFINAKKNIEEKGYNEGEFFVMLGTGMIIICIGLNEIRKRVSNQIDLIDKQEN